MSKAVGSIFGSGSTGTYGFENNYTNYLNNYNTGNYDNTLNNLTANALSMSQNLGAMPNYIFSVNASDDARRAAEQAVYQAYVDKLTPQYQQQQADLETSLANKGISVGSEAYQRAMNDLQSTQNAALNQAAYNSVIAGQNAYDNSLSNSISAANFSNNARQNYISQILSQLQNSVSGYENQMNLYNAQHGIQARRTQDEESGWKNLSTAVRTASSIAPLKDASHRL